MNTLSQPIMAGGSSRRIAMWLVGVMIIVALDGCSGKMLQAQADYHALQATASASHGAVQAQAQDVPAATSMWIEATRAKDDIIYQGQQSENQALITILEGWLILAVVVTITTVAVVRYRRHLQWKTMLEERFIYSVEYERNRFR